MRFVNDNLLQTTFGVYIQQNTSLGRPRAAQAQHPFR